VVRLTSAGAPDTSFSDDGIVTIDIAGDSDDRGTAVVVDGSGNVVVAGSTGDQDVNTDFVLVRYTSSGVIDTTFGGAMAAYTTDGTLDDGFNGNGKLPVPLGSSFPHLTGVALQPDGKIVASGVVGAGFGLVRVTSGGSLDPISMAMGGRQRPSPARQVSREPMGSRCSPTDEFWPWGAMSRPRTDRTS
jgi:uncharacterized delta-60 repeat protein